MTPEELKHISNNVETITVWIDTHQRLQQSNDILSPIITAYERETGNSTRACQDCLIDALIWAKLEWNKTNPAPKKKMDWDKKEGQ